MSAENVKSSSRSNREELGKWFIHITKDDFIGQYIYPMVADAQTSKALDCETSVVQDTGTGRLTLRYKLNDGAVIYAKLYTDNLGYHSYCVLRALWEQGFNHQSLFQVSEPLAYLPEYKLLLMRGVEGKPLSATFNSDSKNLIEGVQKAAQWLAALHRCSIRIGEPEPDWDSLKIFRVCVRLIKATAAQPEMRDKLLDLVHLLKQHIGKLPQRRPITQTHGRYHHDHVYLNGETTSVIDLDRSRPTDPAKDAAEFVRVLRFTAFKHELDMNAVDKATGVFLEEYLSHVPDAGAGLAYYWASFILLSLLGLIKKLPADDPRWQKYGDFHLKEMKLATEIRL